MVKLLTQESKSHDTHIDDKFVCLKILSNCCTTRMPQLGQLFKTRGYNEVNRIVLKDHMGDLPAWLAINKLTKVCKKVLRKQIGKSKISLLRKQGKLTEEMEILKVPDNSQPEKNWKTRRSQKLDKMEILNLQANLQSEIQAKQEISKELSKIRAELEASRKCL